MIVQAFLHSSSPFIRWVLPSLAATDARWTGFRLAVFFVAWLGTAPAPGGETTADRAEAERLVLRLEALDTVALRLAVQDLSASFPDRYGTGPAHLQRLERFEKRRDALLPSLKAGAPAARDEATGFLDTFRRALLENPLLDFDRIVLLRRNVGDAATSDDPRQWGVPPLGGITRADLMRTPRDNQLVVLSNLRGQAKLEPLYQPAAGRVLGDIAVHWDGERLLFSAADDRQRWAVYQLQLRDKQVTRTTPPDADFFDATYLPDGQLVAVGRLEQGSYLHRLDPRDGLVQRLTFEDAPDAMPCIGGDGRLRYLRGRVPGEPPEFERLLFHCNPAGTGQRADYGGVTKLVRVQPGGPMFLHVYPLGDKYFLAAAKPEGGLWGIYLIDVFGNRTLLAEASGSMLLEPIPLRPTKVPPVLPTRYDPESQQATVYVHNLYAGPGLRGIPRGRVKRLRVLALDAGSDGEDGTFQASPQRKQGDEDGPLLALRAGVPPLRILGTVAVREDGSTMFRIPANTPISLQPLDEQGRALQLMRSSFVAMPGEQVNCGGCHEQPTDPVPAHYSLAGRNRPARVEPWYGLARSFHFEREVQPVLDKHCSACHKGGEKSPDPFSLFSLWPYVFHPLPPGDRTHRVLTPGEYHASATELVQTLQKGHYDVALDQEAWERLYTWIDLSAMFSHPLGAAGPAPAEPPRLTATERPPAKEEIAEPVSVPGWPFDAAEARRRQQALTPAEEILELGRYADGPPVTLRLVKIPAGDFAMGDPHGQPDERQVAWVKIDKPFWMAAVETTNAMYGLCDPARVGERAARDPDAASPNRPVTRVSWQDALDFCQWLSTRTGRRFTLPTEAQWEWAARCGSATPFWFGDARTDFKESANLSAELRPIPTAAAVGSVPPASSVPFFTSPVASFRPNPWGLYDMHGNVAEWTLSDYRPFPYDSRLAGTRVVRGGSWRDRPFRATASFRLAYKPYQSLFDVGFRVVCEIP